MHSIARRVGLWAASAAGTILIATIGKMINLDYHVVAALAAVTLIGSLIVAESPGRKIAIGGLVLALIILPVGILTQQPAKAPSIDGVEKYFVPESVDGQSIRGHVEFINKSGASLRISKSHLSVSGAFSVDDTEAREIENNASTQFVVDQPNELALKGGKVSLQFGYSLDAGASKSIEAEVTFTVPLGVQLNKPIPQTTCCSPISTVGLDDAPSRDLQFRLMQDDSYFLAPDLAERDASGAPMKVWAYTPKRRFSIDFAKGEILLARPFKNNVWQYIGLRPDQTENTRHYVRVGWNDTQGWSYLVVDRHAILYDVERDKVYPYYPTELLCMIAKRERFDEVLSSLSARSKTNSKKLAHDNEGAAIPSACG